MPPPHVSIQQYGSNLGGTSKKRRSSVDSDSTDVSSTGTQGICLADLGNTTNATGFVQALVQSSMEDFTKVMEKENVDRPIQFTMGSSKGKEKATIQYAHSKNKPIHKRKSTGIEIQEPNQTEEVASMPPKDP